MRKISTQRGFSLIELMVVVVIIAILTVIAIPQYDKYKSKALVSEAKIALGAIYQNEIAFFQEARMYCVCLSAIGYSATLNSYYAKGFNIPQPATPDASSFGCAPGTAAGVNLLAQPNPTFSYTYFSADKTARAAGTRPADATALPATQLTVSGTASTGFIAGAGGYISKNASLVDRWTINEQQNIIHVSVGY